MHNHYRYYLAITVLLLTTESIMQSFPLKKTISSFFGPQQEELVHKEYTIEKNGVISIDNLSGSIQVKAAWKSNQVMIKAVKKGTAGDLATLAVTEKTITPNKIHLATEQSKENAGGTIDYLLIVPQSVSLELTQHNGSIKIKQVYGAITASTDNGSIELHESHNTVRVSTSKGSITLVEPQGNVHATTMHGSIDITDSTKSVIASTESGSITAHCKEVPATARIDLKTHSGAITLHVPSEVNADVQAKTVNGRIISNHLITLKPVTTKLDRTAWSQFKKEVNGTIGSGEATIALHATNSTIKILEYSC